MSTTAENQKTYIIAGSAGVGKTTLASKYSNVLNTMKTKHITDKIMLEDYLKDPCGTYAAAYWKQGAFKMPEGMLLHSADGCELNLAEYELTHEITKYFKLIHRLESVPNVNLNSEFVFATADIKTQKGIVADIINACYDASFSIETIKRWTEYEVFDSDLWVFVLEKNTEQPVALGIADFDKEIGEGLPGVDSGIAATAKKGHR